MRKAKCEICDKENDNLRYDTKSNVLVCQECDPVKHMERGVVTTNKKPSKFGGLDIFQAESNTQK